MHHFEPPPLITGVKGSHTVILLAHPSILTQLELSQRAGRNETRTPAGGIVS